MAESLGTLAYELVVEIFLAAALLWMVAILSLHLLSINDPAWRARFFLVPVIIPIAVVPLIHLVIRPHSTQTFPALLEDSLLNMVRASPVMEPVFLGICGAVLLLGVVQALLPLVATSRCWLEWRQQRLRQTSAWLQCDGLMRSVASILRMSPARLVLTDAGACSSISLIPFHSYISVPQDLVSTLDDEEIEAMFAHELGHIRRRDTLLGTLARICRDLLGFSPFVRSAYQGFAWAREEVVDDLAVHAGSRPLALASCLVKACQFSQGNHGYSAGNGLFSSMDAMERRIQRLIENEASTGKTQRWCPCVFAGVVTASVTFLLFTV